MIIRKIELRVSKRWMAPNYSMMTYAVHRKYIKRKPKSFFKKLKSFIIG